MQKTIGGKNNYVEIGEETSSGSQSTKAYEFIDRDVKQNIRYQYSLLIQSASSIKYSAIKRAMIKSKGIAVSPNPATEFIQVTVNEY